jgi:glutamyl-tRNA synthetase
MIKKEKENLNMPIRVRIAPSPTGALHIGTARSALFNYLFAKKNKGKFILRIEDTDKERSELRWGQDILEGLKWLGIEWDEGPDIGGDFGPYKQSQRNNFYEKYLNKLLEENKAYYCFCKPEDLENKRQDQMSRGLAPKYDGTCAHLSKEIVEKNLSEKKPCVIRFRIENKKIKFKDLIRGDVELDMGLTGDIVIAKNMETPLYNFTAVIDDFEMKISHVIRGEDHISNTPKQISIQDALGFPHPTYSHLPLILAPDRSKMSKRFGAVSVTEYKTQGYLPEALINFMALLGWNPGTDQETFSLSQLSKEFSIEKVQKGGAIFNIQKLDFINAFYIREKPIEKLTELCVPYLKKAGLLVVGQVTQNKLQEIIEVSKTRMKKLSDIVELSDFFFQDKLIYDSEMLKWHDPKGTPTNEEIKDSLMFSEKILSEFKSWELKALEIEMFEASVKFNLEKNYPEKNKGYLLWPLRVALSGKQSSPSPFEIASILGKEKTIKRIQEAIKLL